MYKLESKFMHGSWSEVLMPYIGLLLLLSNIIYYCYNYWS